MATRKRKKQGKFPPESADQSDRLRILEASEERFRRYGFSRVSVDEIASELRMSKKTIYKIFPSKEALLSAVLRVIMTRVEARIDAVFRSDRPSLEKMTQMLSIAGAQYLRFSREFRADVGRSVPRLWKEVEAFRRRQAMTKILPTLRQAKAEGMLRSELNPDMFFLVLLTAIEGVLNPYTLAEQPFSAEEAFAGIFSIMFQGALTPSAVEQLRTTFSVSSIIESSRLA